MGWLVCHVVLKRRFPEWSYKNDGTESGVVGIGQAVDEGVERIAALDIVIDSCGITVFSFDSGRFGSAR